ncbi:glutaconyl-CoA decarboxylase subunit gamma [Peptoniphilus lacrimalis DNF00528]|uniref:Glutaconyl-CoA decarboxylase subunit gamma n=1 Tax=Peptoniphilus lacrimalis 315-B TaxID=596330 RepID=D1VVD4_9FIRM|nr:biotin/lipoyl-containing protein [Peptoniphilus lacrimalis]EFA89439.1 glutaconyl-CoA decarboxylase subunit gamma [Peptoniphilus lacrimalis 315-B]KGF37024.1 glutaconyl-CoA decarboxylase subunit gamma [Peptoniphilus lacrimalis DNF00528]
MKYQVKVDGKIFEVEVEKVGGGYQSLTPGSLNAAGAFQPQAQPVQQQAQPAPAPAAASAPAAPAASGSGADGEVVSPMPGKILKVIADNGAHVEAGDVILILEAMKMENEIVAPIAGTVSLSVSVGQTVDTDALLATVK